MNWLPYLTFGRINPAWVPHTPLPDLKKVLWPVALDLPFPVFGGAHVDMCRAALLARAVPSSAKPGARHVLVNPLLGQAPGPPSSKT